MAQRKRGAAAPPDDALNTVDGVRLANLPPLPPPVALPTDREQALEREIDEVLAELGSQCVVKVQRVNPDTGSRAHVGTLDGEGFNVDALADTFGGGKYYVRVLVGKEVVYRGHVEVDPAIPPKNPRAKAMAAPSSLGGGAMLDQLAGVMATMMTANMQNANMMQQMMAGMTQSTATMMQTLATVLASRKESDPIETVRAMAELLRPAAQGGNEAAAEALKMLREGIALGRELDGGGGGSDSMVGMIAEGLRAFGPVLANAGQRSDASSLPAVPAHVASAPVPPVAVPVAHEAAPPSSNGTHLHGAGGGGDVAMHDDGARPWVREARQYMPQLGAAFRLQFNPETVVDMIVRGTTEVMWDDLGAFYDEAPGTFVDRARAALPELAQFGEWGGEVLTALADQLGQPDDGDDGEARPVPDGTNR